MEIKNAFEKLKWSEYIKNDTKRNVRKFFQLIDYDIGNFRELTFQNGIWIY